MTAVEKGYYSVIRYLKGLDGVLSIGCKPFPKWFEQDFEYYNLVSQPGKSHWKWGEHDRVNLIIQDEGRKVSRERDRPPAYSSVVADIILCRCVHWWKVQISNPEHMWISVAISVSSQEQLSVYPGYISGEERYLILFGLNDPEYIIFIGNKRPNFTLFTSKGYQSGSIIEFELDSYELSLKCWVDKRAYDHCYKPGMQ